MMKQENTEKSLLIDKIYIMTQKELNEKITDLIKNFELSQGLRIRYMDIRHNSAFYNGVEEDTLKIQTVFENNQPIKGLCIADEGIDKEDVIKANYKR